VKGSERQILDSSKNRSRAKSRKNEEKGRWGVGSGKWEVVSLANQEMRDQQDIQTQDEKKPVIRPAFCFFLTDSKGS